MRRLHRAFYASIGALCLTVFNGSGCSNVQFGTHGIGSKNAKAPAGANIEKNSQISGGTQINFVELRKKEVAQTFASALAKATNDPIFLGVNGEYVIENQKDILLANEANFSYIAEKFPTYGDYLDYYKITESDLASASLENGWPYIQQELADNHISDIASMVRDLDFAGFDASATQDSSRLSGEVIAIDTSLFLARLSEMNLSNSLALQGEDHYGQFDADKMRGNCGVECSDPCTVGVCTEKLSKEMDKQVNPPPEVPPGPPIPWEWQPINPQPIVPGPGMPEPSAPPSPNAPPP